MDAHLKTTLVGGLAVALLLGCSAPGRFVVRVERAEIQSRLDQRFPIKREVFIFELRLGAPQVALNAETDRVEVQVTTQARAAGQVAGSATARISGGVRYDATEHTFYLTDPRLEAFDAMHLPKRLVEPARRAVDEFAATVLPEVPIFELAPDRHGMARVFLKRVWLSDGVVHLEMGL
jgi:hypothetical protein